MFDYLTGIYNITPTPFNADGTLDEPSLRRLTEFTRGTRVNGMTILGVLGEADHHVAPGELAAVAPAQHREVRRGAVGPRAARIGEVRDGEGGGHPKMVAQATARLG